MSLRDELLTKRAKIDAGLAELEAIEESGDRDPIAAPAFLSEGGEIPWLIGGLMVEGSINMLVADPKVGKTTLIVQLSLALSAGLAGIWGFSIVRAVRVLMIEAEGSRAAFRARLSTAVKSMNLTAPPRWFIQPEGTSDFDLTSPTIDNLIARSRAEVVVLDTLGYFHHGNLNDASDWKKCVMRPLRKLASKHGCSFILVHHHGKASEERQGAQKALGSYQMFGDCDLWLRMEKVGDTPERKVWVDGNKYGRMDYDIPLTFNPSGAIFTW